MKKLKRCSGFTVIEVLITTSIVVVIAAAVFQLLFGGQAFYGTGEARVQAEEHTRRLLDQLGRLLHEAPPENVYIRNSTAQAGSFGPIQETIGTTINYRGDSILFQVPCRHRPSGATMLSSEDNIVLFGAQDQNNDWQDDLWFEYCLVDVTREGPTPRFASQLPETSRMQLRRRVWQDTDINLDSLAIRQGANPVQEQTLSGSIHGLTFRALAATSPVQLEVTVIGHAWDTARRQEVLNQATSELALRN